MLSIVLALGAADPGLPHSWAEFGRAAALSHVEEKVEIATTRTGAAANFPIGCATAGPMAMDR